MRNSRVRPRQSAIASARSAGGILPYFSHELHVLGLMPV